MTAARKRNLCSTGEYLEAEVTSSVKHEYLGGFIYAMHEATNVHNAIASNVLVALGSRLRGQKCRPYNSDTKIRIRLPAHTRIYYPDVSIVCLPNPPEDSFQDEPLMLVEVLSDTTRRLDECEKREAYLTIGSLAVLLFVEQHTPSILIYGRKEQGFVGEVYDGLDAVVPLDELGTSLPLAEVYEAVGFTPVPSGG